MNSWLLWALLAALRVGMSWSKDGALPPVPRGVSVDADFASQVLSISWEKDLVSPVEMYDVEILRTELEDIVYNETVEVNPNFPGKFYHLNWTSTVPLECTSHSVRLRSRHLQLTSDWTSSMPVLGKDLPDDTGAKMFPQDRVVLAGSNMTFCCIMGEGKEFGRFQYFPSNLTTVKLSRRSYAGTVTNQPPSKSTGTNVICRDSNDRFNSDGNGAVVFVGYPPGDKDLLCETRDLETVECRWSTGQDTHLRGPRQTFYTLNGRDCLAANKQARGSKGSSLQCNVALGQGDRTWTLEAKNPLGTVQLRDTADLSQRVRPYPPLGVSSSETYSRNASLSWRWGKEGYAALPLECQVEVNNSERDHVFGFSGRGLKQATVLGLQPDEQYAARVRCRLLGNLWKWGNWSSSYKFKTQEERADPLDIWACIDTNQTDYIKWKALSKSQSHGQILEYQVTYGRPEEGDWQVLSLPHTEHGAHLSLGPDGDYTIMVIARNKAGESPPSSVTVPRFEADRALAPDRVYGTDGGFDLSWPPEANASCGYVVEWHRTGKQDCNWRKVPAGNASARIESESFEAGVQYSFSIYACTSGTPQLLGRREGYVKELAPAGSGEVNVQPYGSDVQLRWDEIPLESRRGFIRGYIIYISNGSRLVPIENITDPEVRSYRMRNVQPGFYKFTVQAYTSAGPNGGAIATLKLDPSSDWLLGEILIALGAMTAFLILMTVICYKKRRWVQKTFYPEIPEPKLQDEWSTTAGGLGSRTLDVEPCPHSTVHIVENPDHDSGKLEPTVELVNEEESSGSSSDTDSSDPVILRYYNQVVDDGSRGPPMTDSSASSSSSMASNRTDVTYTGIQTSASSSVMAPQDEASSAGGYKPQMAPTPDPAEPLPDPIEPADLPLLGAFNGYQPQSSWREDSPECRSLNSSLGSPTSVNSSQFLLPDPASEEGGAERAPSTTWFHNLLSGKP